MVAFAVNTAGFQECRFPMKDSVWESESFVGLRNFTLMADMKSLRPLGVLSDDNSIANSNASTRPNTHWWIE
jgi:hypothetical protein